MTFAWNERELNEQQAAAVLEPESVFLVACPGSGKTRALTYKIGYELSRLESKKSFVVAITYTHRAADEIHERIEDLGVDTSQLWIGTIHSFCLEWILKPYGIYLPELSRGFKIIDSHEQQTLLEELCVAEAGITFWDCDYYFTEDGYHLGCRDHRKHEGLRRVFERYFQRLLANRQIDFELILYYAIRLIRIRPQIAHLLAQIIPLVLVDEYQDTKLIQYSIVAAIVRSGAGSTKVFIVGDPNQAIYGSLGGFAMPVADFRALCGINILERELSDNYRSSNRLIEYFSNFNVHLTNIHGAARHHDYESTVSYNAALPRIGLEDELARLIRLSVEGQGFSPNQICVLAPWWILLASVTRRLVAALPGYEFDGPGMIPFSRDPENFWYRLSRIALTEASPTMYVRRIRWAKEVISDLADSGIDVSRFTAKQFLRECNSVQIAQNDGLLFLREFFEAVFVRLGIDFRSYTSLLDHHLAFFNSSQAKIEKLRAEGAEFVSGIEFFRKVFRHRTGITVTTIHGVKGAEFDVVIAYGLLEGMVPHFSEQDGENSAKKLLYVVSSRARKNLYLISEQGRNRGFRGQYEATAQLAQYQFGYDVV